MDQAQAEVVPPRSNALIEAADGAHVRRLWPDADQRAGIAELARIDRRRPRSPAAPHRTPTRGAVAPCRERWAEEDDIEGQEGTEGDRVQRIAADAGHAGRPVGRDDGGRHVQAAEAQAWQRLPVNFPLCGAVAAAQLGDAARPPATARGSARRAVRWSAGWCAKWRGAGRACCRMTSASSFRAQHPSSGCCRDAVTHHNTRHH